MICSIGNAKDEEKNEKILEPVALSISGHVCYTPEDGIKLGELFTDYDLKYDKVVKLELDIESLERENAILSKDKEDCEDYVRKSTKRGELYLESYSNLQMQVVELQSEKRKKRIVAVIAISCSLILGFVGGVFVGVK